MERDVPSTDLVELLGDAKEVAEELEVLDGVDLLGELLLHLGIRLLAKLLVQSFSHSMLDLYGLLLAVKAVPDILVCLLICAARNLVMIIRLLVPLKGISSSYSKIWIFVEP